MSELQSRTRYDPAEVEPRIAEQWLQSGIYHPEAEGDPAENFSIAIPPPNVTGVLHMGHALNNSIQDCLVRRARMQGRRTKWILGTDHAGIATQTQVERMLAEERINRQEIGRDDFVQRVWSWREQYGGEIIEQLKRLGASCDYEDERFTLDERYAEAVGQVFVSLYEKGLIYRDRYLVNWDPGSRSAISDLEVEEREVTDTLYYIDYPLASGSGAVTIATVRPETMLGDTAIAVHPDDERYRRLIGETALLPLAGRRLKIIADEYVKPEFGTGALKITPGHDLNDFEIGRRHGLEQLSVIGEDGRMIAPAPERFVGLTVMEARRAIVEELRELGLIPRTEPLQHTVPFSHRSGERIEPLVSLQWFMSMDELAAPAIAAVQEGALHITPDSERRRYLDWLANIRPWCISRQLWWGHRLPVYLRGEEVHVGLEPPAGPGWERDPDVLDTWFSSALWPFATLGWPWETPQLRAFYPTDVLSTARDIIFLWVARMVMLGIEFTGQIPFRDVYVHSIIQAPDGRRMSKSLGTGIDPMALIEGGPRPPVLSESAGPSANRSGEAGGRADGKSAGEFPAYGADAVRWGLLAMSSGQDVRFNEERVAQGRGLTNKLWNASRLILLGVDPAARAAPKPTTVEDRWILSRLARTREEVDTRIGHYEFSRAALVLYDFVYGELCDWYLELAKPRLRAGEADLDSTLLYVLSATLILAHPLIPFVTEEIYSFIPGPEGLLAAGRPLPGSAPEPDPAAEQALGLVIEAVQALRAWRDSARVPAGARLPVRISGRGLHEAAVQIAGLARLTVLEGSSIDQPVATVAVGGGAIEILPNDALDPEAAGKRRQSALARLEEDIERALRKLANPGFLAKARPEVVQAERDKLARLRDQREAL